MFRSLNREKANKQLAHLSRWRIKLARDGLRDWEQYGEIAEDLEKVIKIFGQMANTKF